MLVAYIIHFIYLFIYLLVLRGVRGIRIDEDRVRSSVASVHIIFLLGGRSFLVIFRWV
jgi:hypothetical protein